MRPARRLHVALLPAIALLGCRADSDQVVFALEAHSFKNSEWSVPVNVGPPINSAFLDAAPALSKDGLTLYFTSNRPGGFGGNDLWVSHRDCAEISCPWGDPVNLGSTINTAAIENAANLSVDGHLLYFFSNRAGGQGNTDIWLSRRADPNNDFGWGAPVSVGPDVNTADFEQRSWYQQNAEGGSGNLYFSRGAPAAGAQDIYFASVTRDGETRGPAVFVTELNDPTGNDAGVTLRADGREIFFHSFRSGTLGLSDLWTARRPGVGHPWGTPVHLGAPMSSAGFDQQPSLSHDGRTLLWASTRSGGLGALDIWMSTRTPSGK